MAGFTLSSPGALIVSALEAAAGGALPVYAVQTSAPVSCNERTISSTKNGLPAARSCTTAMSSSGAEPLSARSTRGLTFHLEPGVRLPAPYVDPAVVRLGSDEWLMAVSTIERGRRQRIYLAESKDGLRWKVEPRPLVDDAGASDFDPTLLALGRGRYRIYYTHLRGTLFELLSGIVSAS